MSANSRAYLALGIVFLLGIGTGAGAMYAYGRRASGHLGEGPRGRQHIERRVAALTAQLKLSSEQVAQVTAVLERQREPRSKLWHETMERCGEPLHKLRAATDAELRTLLRADQQRQFDELLQARDRRNAAP